MKWYQGSTPRRSYVGKQVVIQNSSINKKGTIVTLVEWADEFRDVIKIRNPVGIETLIHAGRVKPIEDNKSAIALLEVEQ